MSTGGATADQKNLSAEKFQYAGPYSAFLTLGNVTTPYPHHKLTYNPSGNASPLTRERGACRGADYEAT